MSSANLQITIQANTSEARRAIGKFASDMKRMFAGFSSKGAWGMTGVSGGGPAGLAAKQVETLLQAINKVKKATGDAKKETKSWYEEYKTITSALASAKLGGMPVDKSVQDRLVKQGLGIIEGAKMSHLKGEEVPDADKFDEAHANLTKYTKASLEFAPAAQAVRKELEATTHKYKGITKELELLKRSSPQAHDQMARLAKAGIVELEKKSALIRQVVVQQIEGVKGVPVSGGGSGALAQIKMQITAMEKLLSLYDREKLVKQSEAGKDNRRWEESLGTGIVKINERAEKERSDAEKKLRTEGVNQSNAFLEDIKIRESQGSAIVSIITRTNKARIVAERELRAEGLMQIRAAEEYKRSIPGLIDQITQLTGKTHDEIRALHLEEAQYKNLLKAAKTYYGYVNKFGHPPHGSTSVQSYIDHSQNIFGTQHGETVAKEVLKAKEVLTSRGLIPAEEVTKWSKIRDFASDIVKYAHFQVRWFASAGALFAIAGAIKSASVAALNFYQTLKNIQAVTGVSDLGIREVADAAMEVSETTPLAANRAAEMGLKLIQAGLSANEAAAAMKTVAAVTTVSGEDMQGSIGAITTAMFAWKLQAEEMPRIGNAIAGALNYSRLTVEDLNTAFNYLASTSSIMNRSMEETVANMAVLSNMGLRASTIGTNLAQLYAQLISPSKKLNKELNRIGLSANDVNPSMHKLSEIIERLTDKGFNASKAFEMLEDRAGRLLAAALVATGKEFANMEVRIREKTKLHDGLKKAMEGPNNALALMRNRLSALAIHLFSVSEPLIKSFTVAVGFLAFPLTKVVEGFGLVASTAPKTTVALLFLAPALLGIWKIFTGLKTIIPAVGASILSFSTILRFASMHPVILAFTALATVLGLVGLAYGRTKKSAEETEKAITSNDKIKARQAQIAKSAEAAVQAHERAATGLKEAWASTARIDIKLPLADQISVLTMKIGTVIEKIKQLRWEHEQGFQTPTETMFSKLNDQMNVINQINDLKAGKGQFLGMSEKDKAPLLAMYEKANRMLQADIKKAAAKGSIESLGATIGSTIAELRQGLKKAGASLTVEAINQTVKAGEPTEIERLIKLRERLATEEKRLRAEFDAAATAYDSAKPEDQAGAIEERMLSATNALSAFYSTLESMPDVVGAASFGKNLADDIKKAENSAISSERALAQLREEISALQVDDPYRKIQARIAREKLEIEDQIAELKRQAEEAGKKAKQAAQGGVSTGTSKYNSLQANLQRDIRALEERKAELSNKQAAEISLVDDERALQWAKIKHDLTVAAIDQKERLFEIEQKLGMSAEQAARTQIHLANEKVRADIQLLELEMEKTRNEDERKKKLEEISIIQMKLLSPGEEMAAWQKSRIEGLDKEISKLTAREELFAEDHTVAKQRHEIEAKILKLQQEGAITAEQAIAAREKWNRMATGDGLSSVWENFAFGFNDAIRGFTDLMVQMRDLGKSTADSLQKGFSDVFYKLSTMEGFDKEKHKNYWEFMKDVADDFLKSIYQNFMRTLADIWAKWMISFIKMMVMKAVAGFGSGGGTVMAGENISTSNVGHQGGLRTESGIKRYHTGGLAHDERLSILQTGEYVVSRKGVRALDAINQGKVSAGGDGGGTAHYYNIQAMDPKSFRDFALRNPGVFSEMFTRDMRMAGSTRSATRAYA